MRYCLFIFCILMTIASSCGNDEQIGRTDCAEYNGYKGGFELVDGKCVCPKDHYYLEDHYNYYCYNKGEFTYKVEMDSNHCFISSPNNCSPNIGILEKQEWGDFFNILPNGCLDIKYITWNKLDDGSVEISFEVHPFLVSSDCKPFAALASCESLTGFAYGRSDPANTKIDIEVRYIDLCKDVELGKGYIYLRK